MVLNRTGAGFGRSREAGTLKLSRAKKARFASTSGQAKKYDREFAPYGEQYGLSGSGIQIFTGQEQDGADGLFEFLAREYSPVQGRWMSSDPAGMRALNLVNPQTLNRYAYVSGNPLGSVDPDGLGCLINCGEGPQSPGNVSGTGIVDVTGVVFEGHNLTFRQDMLGFRNTEIAEVRPPQQPNAPAPPAKTTAVSPSQAPQNQTNAGPPYSSDTPACKDLMNTKNIIGGFSAVTAAIAGLNALAGDEPGALLLGAGAGLGGFAYYVADLTYQYACEP